MISLERAVKAAFILGLLGILLYPGPFLVSETKPFRVENPKPTHVEKNYIELVKVKEIASKLEDEEFLARPDNLTVDNEGNIYVYDDILNKVFFFDKAGKIKKVVGQVGRGPGDLGEARIGAKYLYYAENGYIYLSDYMNRKMLVYDKQGNHVKDIVMPFREQRDFYPAVDGNGHYYVISTTGAVDELDADLKKVFTYGNLEDYNRFVAWMPKSPAGLFRWNIPSDWNTRYDVLPGNRLVVLLENSATIFIYKNRQLAKRFDVIPQKGLALFKDRIDRMREKAKKLKRDEDFSLTFYVSFFVDKDDPRFFYLESGFDEERRRILYRFDLDGKLDAVLFAKCEVSLLFKRNGLFYAIGSEGRGDENDRIIILKEVKR